MAVQRRGSVKVLVQPPRDSFEAMATLLFSSPFGQDLEEEFGAVPVEFHVAEHSRTRPRSRRRGGRQQISGPDEWWTRSRR